MIECPSVTWQGIAQVVIFLKTIGLEDVLKSAILSFVCEGQTSKDIFNARDKSFNGTIGQNHIITQ